MQESQSNFVARGRALKGVTRSQLYISRHSEQQITDARIDLENLATPVLTELSHCAANFLEIHFWSVTTAKITADDPAFLVMFEKIDGAMAILFG
jgi:hypothetical protein